ncbi:roadblock/LC7 domain-containing protein [Deinococcus sp. PESE-38]
MGAPPPALDSVATLVASNAAATTALANMLGEPTFAEQTHQGENGTLYVESVGTDALLTLIFDSSVALGKVKVYARKTIGKLEPILDEVRDLPEPELGADFSQGATALLDDLLG